MATAMSREAWNAHAGRAIWERDGRRCVRCDCELPDYRDSRTDEVATGAEKHERTLCLPCYVLRGDARRWRTANIGAMIAAGILPSNWRDLVWYDSAL